MVVGLLVLAISIFVSSLTGLFVIASNPKIIINRVYALFTSALVLFSIFNYFSLGSMHKLTYIRLVMVTTTLSLCGAYFLAFYLNSSFKKFTRMAWIVMLSTIVIAILDMTPWVFKGIKHTHNLLLPIATYGLALYLIQFFGVLILAILILWNGTQATSGIRSQQNKYILVGLIPTLVFAPITGFILPIGINNSSFIFLSPIYATFTVCLIGYAIVKHGLFDIRLVVARALAYFLSLSVVSAIFGFIAIALIKVFFHPQLSVVAEIALAISTALAALSFQRVKKVFDKFSNRVFYRDSYNVQTFLDAFNRVLVSTYELAPLLRRISILIEDNLKPAYCLFGINGYEKNAASWTQPSTKVPLSEEEIKFIQDFVTRTKTKLIIADLIEDKYSDFQKYLQKRDIAVFAKLATSNREGDIGYFMLGSKKSGNMYTSQDIDVLEIVINELVVAIQNALHTEEIEQFNITLQDKIKDATYRLRSTNEKLRALDEAKDDFVSMASHQLRTPLTSVKGNLSLVLDGDAGKISSLQRQMLQQAYGSSQRMVYLIADLLNVSRLKTGKFVIEPSVVNLASVVEDEVNQLMETAKSRNLNLKFIKENKIDNLMLDETKTRQVIMNFIDNAIYYTPSGGEIDVYVKETQSAIECRVVDNGIGVPKNEIHHLFTKFYRAKNARKARPDGTGLGLFMAKKVIVSEGGALIFDSEEGKGSTFGFSFPKSKLAVSNTNAPATAPEPAAATQNA